MNDKKTVQDGCASFFKITVGSERDAHLESHFLLGKFT